MTGGMQSYRVWDELNQTEEDARAVDAFTPSGAAEAFAEADEDGICDGAYLLRGRPSPSLATHGQPVSVRNVATGELRRFRVGIVEYEPVFASCEVSDQAAGTPP